MDRNIKEMRKALKIVLDNKNKEMERLKKKELIMNFKPICMSCTHFNKSTNECSNEECVYSYGPCSLCSAFDHDYGSCLVDDYSCECSTMDYSDFIGKEDN